MTRGPRPWRWGVVRPARGASGRRRSLLWREPIGVASREKLRAYYRIRAKVQSNLMRLFSDRILSGDPLKADAAGLADIKRVVAQTMESFIVPADYYIHANADGSLSVVYPPLEVTA